MQEESDLLLEDDDPRKENPRELAEKMASDSASIMPEGVDEEPESAPETSEPDTTADN
jgi:hypothetical protein